MLTVTKSALEQLSHRLARRPGTEGLALRFVRREGGWRLRLDRESPGDAAFTHGDRKVLLLDAAVAEALADMTLDVKPTGTRSRLDLRRNGRRGD